MCFRLNGQIKCLLNFSLQWLMKVEVALYNYSQGTNFFWMFVEGLYLHIIIVWTYSADKIKLRYLFVIGWSKYNCKGYNAGWF